MESIAAFSPIWGEQCAEPPPPVAWRTLAVTRSWPCRPTVLSQPLPPSELAPSALPPLSLSGLHPPGKGREDRAGATHAAKDLTTPAIPARGRLDV
jgi:hypothetical protein